MANDIQLDEFLTRNRVHREMWEKSGLEWRTMQEIARDHESQVDRLRDSAELFARVIQRFASVHSVRWRVKETEHLLEKIIRKRADEEDKYKAIAPDNYFEVVTDLVGLRALHLFKDECFTIDSSLRQTWVPSEQPVAYVRVGDPPDLTDKFQSCGFEVKQHPAGYRSVHYVCSTQPLQRKVYAEIQVRTIFEAGWSEIDHRVRYPNFSNNQLVAYFLTIFNRLAGSADEMGAFVQGLTDSLRAFDSQISDANRQKDEALAAADRLLADLEAMKRQDADAKQKVIALQQEIAKLRKLNSVDEVFSQAQRGALSAIGSFDSKSLFADLNRTPAISEALKLASQPTGLSALVKAIEDSRQQSPLAHIQPPKR